MGFHFEIDGHVATVHPEFGLTSFGLRVDGVAHEVSLLPGEEPGEAILDFDGRRERIWLASKGDIHFIHLRGRAHRIVAIDALERARAESAPSGGAELLRAPMPGVVVSVSTQAGARVARGELLMTIESMKLETAIAAPHDAVVAEVFLAAGASFDQDATLVQLEPVDGEEEQENAK